MDAENQSAPTRGVLGESGTPGLLTVYYAQHAARVSQRVSGANVSRTLATGSRRELTMTRTPPPTLRPMSEFDATQPALLHDQLNDRMIPWTGEQQGQWHRTAVRHGGGVMEWDRCLARTKRRAQRISAKVHNPRLRFMTSPSRLFVRQPACEFTPSSRPMFRLLSFNEGFRFGNRVEAEMTSVGRARTRHCNRPLLTRSQAAAFFT